MSRSSIFRDVDKLSPRYVPKVLQHRDDQMSFLSSLYNSALDNIEKKYLQVSQLVGPVGTGKTSTAIRFGEMLGEKAARRNIKLKHVYLNGKMEGASRYTLYRSLLADVTPKISTRSLSPEDMLRQLVNHLREEDRYLLITMDEIGFFCKHSKEQLIYNLTRLNELTIPKPSRVIGVLFIARDLSFHEHLDPSELSTLGRLIIQFPRYGEQQIKDIIEVRAREAFKPGRVDEELLGFVSDVTASPPIKGDLRVALDLFLYSGMLAEREGYERVLPEHVRRVLGETHPSITTEDILYLSDAGKMILLGMVRALQAEKVPYVGLREIREDYLIVCEEYEVEPVDEVEEEVQELIDRGIVDMKSLTKFGISGVPAEDLERFLNGIMQRLRNGLSKE
ncbi:MAG: Cdc6/Cdc18 family protein [Candidatus Bathyarchaeia archaeon]